jgi:hypothetical protein
VSPTAEIRLVPRHLHPITIGAEITVGQPIAPGEPTSRGRHRALGFSQPPSQAAAWLEHHAGGGFCAVCGVPWPCWASEQPTPRGRHSR